MTPRRHRRLFLRGAVVRDTDSACPMTIRLVDGEVMAAISVEMSESGMSAVAGGVLKVGETVELEPVAGGKLSALVRHKLGGLCGFEFVAPSAERVRRIAENCRKLGRYRSSARSS